MSEDIYDRVTEPSWVSETEKEGLIPTGTYEGQGQGHTHRVGDRDPFVGVDLFRLQVELYEVDGASQRQHFFDVCPTPVRRQSDGQQTTESRLWTQLATATKTVNQSVKETLTTFTMARLRYRLRLSEAKERDGKQYPARNWTDAITIVQ